MDLTLHPSDSTVGNGGSVYCRRHYQMPDSRCQMNENSPIAERFMLMSLKGPKYYKGRQNEGPDQYFPPEPCLGEFADSKEGEIRLLQIAERKKQEAKEMGMKCVD